MNVLVKKSGYGARRNIIHPASSLLIYKKKYDLFKVLNHIHYKLIGPNSFLSNSTFPIFGNKNSVWHLYNGINLRNYPWISTFETSLPRWNTKNRYLIEGAVKRMGSSSCKKLIAISDNARILQLDYVQDNFPTYLDIIEEKLTVLLPPQKAHIEDYSEKKIDSKFITFTIVGADFFLKGGGEILSVFDRLLRKGFPLKLNIVSTLQYGDFASQTTKEDLQNALKIIDRYPNSISHYNKLPNKEVLKLFKNSDIGLLPSYADTFGFSVLEAQACGCPVITTNIRAMPEINNNTIGWVIKVPQRDDFKAKFNTESDRKKLSDILKEKLYKIIGEIVSNRETVKKKGELSLDRIRSEHSPKDHHNKLIKIYRNALD